MAPEYDYRMGSIKATFYKNKMALKENKSLFMFCYHFLNRSDSIKGTHTLLDISDPEDELVPLPNNKEPSAFEKVAEARAPCASSVKKMKSTMNT